MRQITQAEFDMISGGGIIGDAWDDIRRIITEVDDAYGDAISETADMMCRATGDC